MTHIGDDELVLHYYGDGDDRRDVEAHLAACDECRARLSALAGEMEALASTDIPERGDEYGAQVWARVAPLLEPIPSRRWSDRWSLSWFTWPGLALAGGVAVLVVAAFAAGRYWQPPATPTTTVAETPSTVVKERILLVAVGEHLERSRMILAEISNRNTGSSEDLGSERARAEDLVATNRLYRQAALQSGEPAMAATLDELERVLAEIANSPDPVSAAGFERIRERIESQGLLFKVTVLGSQVQQRQRDTLAPRISRTGAST